MKRNFFFQLEVAVKGEKMENKNNQTCCDIENMNIAKKKRTLPSLTLQPPSMVGSGWADHSVLVNVT